MLLLRFIIILTVKNRWLAVCNRNLHDSIHASIPAPPPPHYTLNIFATGKHVNHEGKYGLEITVNYVAVT